MIKAVNDIRDLAGILGLSTSTVSRVLNGTWNRALRRKHGLKDIH